MTMQLTKDILFMQKPSKAESKGDITTQVARSIIEEEMAAREAKSQRLKKLRLRKEAEAADKVPAKRLTSRKVLPRKRPASAGK